MGKGGGYGAIVGVGILGIFLIILGTSNIFGLSPIQCRGLVFVGVSILGFLISGATFSLHWIVGAVVGAGSIALFLIGINAIV